MLTQVQRSYIEPLRKWFSRECFTVDMIARLEDGLDWLLANAQGQAKSDLIGRLTKGDQQRSAVEEVLLATGFVRAFGADNVGAYPRIEGTQKHGEFRITCEGLTFFVEATGLTSPEEDKLIREMAQTGEGYHYFPDTNEETGRLCEKLATKVCERQVSVPLFMCFSQYILDPKLAQTSERLKDFLCRPGDYGVPDSVQLLGIAWSCSYFAQGAWMRQTVCEKYKLSPAAMTLVKEAIMGSYAPRQDNLFDWGIVG